jgi:hypothetical protein
LGCGLDHPNDPGKLAALCAFRYDPRTKFANSVQAFRRLGNAVLVTLQGYGRTREADSSACIDDAVTNYLVTTTTPPRGTICQPDRAPFDPDFGKPLFRD